MADDPEPASIKHEILDKIAALIAAAFGLVAALACNEAIKALFREYFGPTDHVGPMVAYAIIVTLIAVVLTIIVARAASQAKAMLVKRDYKYTLCKFKTYGESEFMEHLSKEHSSSDDKLSQNDFIIFICLKRNLSYASIHSSQLSNWKRNQFNFRIKGIA